MHEISGGCCGDLGSHGKRALGEANRATAPAPTWKYIRGRGEFRTYYTKQLLYSLYV